MNKNEKLIQKIKQIKKIKNIDDNSLYSISYSSSKKDNINSIKINN